MEPTSKSSAAWRDLVVCVLAVLAIFVLSATLDLHGRIDAWVLDYEAWALDELLIAFALGSFGIVWFSHRRWREWRRASQLSSETNRKLTAEIAARREAEASLRESEDWLKQASRIAKLGYYVWDAVEDRCIFCSEEHARIHGLTPEAYVARAAALDEPFTLTHPEDRDRFKAQMRSLRAGNAVELEYRTISLSGEVRYVHETARPVFDEANRVVREIGTSQDITERRQIEEEIRERDTWLRAILKNSPIQIVLKDTDGRIMAVSDNVTDYLDVTTKDFIGKRTDDFLPKPIAQIYMKADEEVLRSGRPLQQETTEEIEDETRHYLNAKFPLTDSAGAIVGICSLTSDVTDQKRAEAQLRQSQKIEAIGQLTGGVAHDFNNLLAVIQGNTELLADKVGRDDPSLQAVFRASRRGADLTDRLLAFSRQQPLRPRPTDLTALICEVTGLLKRTLGETIEIETVAAPGLGKVMVDPGQLENALLNLAINARDAMPGGGRLAIESLNVRLDETDALRETEAVAGDYVVLIVSDSGTGMSAEVQAKAFEPFFTTKDVGQGSGLGLSMVYGFAKQSGGHASLLSEEGRGTTVKIYLPRVESESRSEAAQSPEAEDSPRGRGETVLIIEDDAEVRACAVRTLESLGYRTIDVRDAADATAVLANGRAPDLLFSDVVLPGGVSGPAFAKQAQLDHPGLKVVFISGYPAKAEKLDHAFETDCVLLSKPIRLDPLARALRDALDGPTGSEPARST